MKYASKHLPAALLGHHGYIQQLRAYALLRNDDTLYPSLREEIEKIDRAIDQVSPSYARDVLIKVYRDRRSLKEAAVELGRSLHWVELYHAVGCNDFGMAMDIENGLYDLKLTDDGFVMVPSDHVDEPPTAAEVAELARYKSIAEQMRNDDR